VTVVFPLGAAKPRSQLTEQGSENDVPGRARSA